MGVVRNAQSWSAAKMPIHTKMNFSTVFGYLIAIATLYFTVISDSPNPKMLLEPKAFILVAGGTLSAALVIFPVSALFDLVRVILFGVIFKRKTNRQQLVKEIASAAYLDKSQHYLLPQCPTSHPFLLEGFQLIAEKRLSEADLQGVLTRRSLFFKNSYMADAKMLAVIAKFPSSFGMLGSTVGLIDMMSELGEKGAQGIGPAMAMAMVATFWGLVFTYMFFMPLSDYAVRLATEDFLNRQMIVDGLMMIHRGEKQSVVLEKLNGFLNLGHRLIVKSTRPLDKFFDELDSVDRNRRRNG
jgi:chemotaxis protein MotA